MSKMTMAAVALSFCVSTAVSGQQTTEPLPDALDGVDVVVLVQQGKEIFGKSAFRSTHDRFAYLFSSAENQAEFEKSPEKYAVQMGGLCARMGGTVLGNPSDYVLHEGKIYLFGSDECRKRFADAPSKYIPKPVAPMPADSGAVARGRALLDKAAAAHGGARLDAMTSYVEASTSIQQRQMGPISIVSKNLWRFPADARSERVIPIASGTISVATVLTPAGAWGIGNGGRTTTPPPAAMPSIEATLWRSLIPVLRIRADAKVAALGPVPGAQSLQRVRLVRKGLDVTLAIHSDSGRVHSWSYADRNVDGEVGEISVAFDDFRQVDGVLVPFVENATFNGTPAPGLSRRLDSASGTVTLDPSLFSLPASGSVK